VSTVNFDAGAYRYVPGVFQYSAGVAAMPGHEIVRMRFRDPVPMKEGFARIEHIIGDAGRPLSSFCACELRSPAPFTEDEFKAFNEVYVGTLERWGLYRDGVNPIARSNVCPELAKPAEPMFHAFCFTRVAPDAAPSFVVAGSGEAPEGRGGYGEHTIRLGDTSQDGMRDKTRFVVAEMERRMALLGFAWPDTTAVQVYTVHDFHPVLADEIIRKGAGANGLTWHYNRPPVVGLDFEMDCRGLRSEGLI
jgi:hypothetical protein